MRRALSSCPIVADRPGYPPPGERDCRPAARAIAPGRPNFEVAQAELVDQIIRGETRRCSRGRKRQRSAGHWRARWPDDRPLEIREAALNAALSTPRSSAGDSSDGSTQRDSNSPMNCRPSHSRQSRGCLQISIVEGWTDSRSDGRNAADGGQQEGR
jgi:hypothetical protein